MAAQTTRNLWPKWNPVAPSGPGTRARTRVAALATAPRIITGSRAGLVAAGLAVALAVLVAPLSRVGVRAGGEPGRGGRCPRLVCDAAARQGQRAADPGPVHSGIHRGRRGGRDPRPAAGRDLGRHVFRCGSARRVSSRWRSAARGAFTGFCAGRPTGSGGKSGPLTGESARCHDIDRAEAVMMTILGHQV